MDTENLQKTVARIIELEGNDLSEDEVLEISLAMLNNVEKAILKTISQMGIHDDKESNTIFKDIHVPTEC